MASDTTKTPIKVALVGLTMIQQAIVEFYFATQEGSQKFTEVLGKDAQAYITNFDEQGAIEAWENLYAQENKPTLVLSNCRKDDSNYFYFPRPITPNILLEAADLINNFEGNNNLNITQKMIESSSVFELNSHHDFIMEKGDVVVTKPDALFEALNEELDSPLLSEGDELNPNKESLDTKVEGLRSFEDLALSSKIEERSAPEELSPKSDGLNASNESLDTEIEGRSSFEDLSLSSKTEEKSTAEELSPKSDELNASKEFLDAEIEGLSSFEDMVLSSKKEDKKIPDELSLENDELNAIEESLDIEAEGLSSFGDLSLSSEIKEKNASEELPLESDELNISKESLEIEVEGLSSFDDLVLVSKIEEKNVPDEFSLESDELNDIEEPLDTEVEGLMSFENMALSSEAEDSVLEELSLETLSEGLNSLEELNAFEDLILDTEKEELTLESQLDESISLVELTPDHKHVDSLLDKKLSFDKVNKKTEKPEVADKIDHQDSISMKNADVLFADNQISLSNEKTYDEDKLTSPDELQSFLDELSEKNAEQALDDKKTNNPFNAKSTELRWLQLCGTYEDGSYEKNSPDNTRFKIEETLLPYVADTVSFTERSECWMELSYKPFSIIINPEEKRVYSTLALENPLFVQICSKNIVEELIEYLEVDEAKIEKISSGQLEGKLFSYSLDYFIWTVSLLVSYGRLPEECNPDERMGITNWLSLNKVEKFPYIMQIAAVFNQHHASLNEASAWMTLPKRYVYAFYNGVLALDMIDKKKEKSKKKKLIAMGSDKEKTWFNRG